MKHIILALAGSLLLLSNTQVFAEEVSPENLPPPVIEGDNLEPEVTIIREEKKTTYEYRINGRLYMTKIVPSAGPAYYLLDLDGDGEMDTQRDDPASFVVPQWILYRW